MSEEHDKFLEDALLFIQGILGQSGHVNDMLLDLAVQLSGIAAKLGMLIWQNGLELPEEIRQDLEGATEAMDRIQMGINLDSRIMNEALDDLMAKAKELGFDTGGDDNADYSS